MADKIDHRDFFISFNSADLGYARAIDAALREAGFTTFFHPNDLPPGGNIPLWMDEALMNSAQTLALYSPDYIKDTAVYSRAEHYATWWQEPGTDKRKLIPIVLREATFTPLMAVISRVEVMGLNPEQAAARVVECLKTRKEVEQREHWQAGLPLPKIFNAVYRPNPNFTGRFEATESLQKSLRSGNAAITAVAGMGGVGKTTLAAEYCHRFGGRYAGVWWIRAEQESVMLADLQALGQRLRVVSGQNTEADARATLDHLANVTLPWLLVYDNAPNPDAVRKWLPAGAVRCLITSRFTEFGDVAPVIRLDQWSDDVTVKYLLDRTRRNDRAGATRIAHRLGGLPLAAEQAAVYLNPRTGVSFDDYAADITRLIRRARPVGATGNYPDTVYAAFVKSLDTVPRMDGGEAALNLLRLCAFLSPDGVDIGLVTVGWGGKILPSAFVATMADKTMREDATLASLSLLRRTEGSTGSVLIFHRLLLEVVRDWMGNDGRSVWGTAAVRIVNGAFPGPNPEAEPASWPLCTRLLPHIASLEAHRQQTKEAGRALGRLLNQAGLYLAARGDREGALLLALRTVALARTDEPSELDTALSNLASRYSALDRLGEAEATAREALEVNEQTPQRSELNRAAIFSVLSGVYLKRTNFVEAEPLILRTSDIVKAIYGAHSAEYARSISNLAVLHNSWASQPGHERRQALSEQYATQALTIARDAVGARHPSTALLQNNIAMQKANVGDWHSAVAGAERSLATLFSLDLRQHPDTEADALRLAELWELSGNPDKAERLRQGDISDLLPVIAQIEVEHREWVAKDPMNRHFGPPSPFEPSQYHTA